MRKHALLNHPRTGLPLVPIGYRKSGTPIWPILGASTDDSGGDDAGGEGGGSKGDDDADTGGDTTDWKAEAEKWKKHSRKHEEQSKSNADKAKRFDELEEQNKSDLQKANDLAEANRTAAEQAKAEAAVLRAAIKHKLSEDDLELLGTHGTPEEIGTRAEKLAARLNKGDDSSGSQKKSDHGGGDRGDDVKGKKGQLTRDQLKGMTEEQIVQAKAEGRLDDALGIKTT